ncbi:MCM family protein [Heterostelium album PN500]|uniref:DNA replication licensing factor MCM5 n=1 Tax=Heterostelium pallidum (strain ATCC 26659 / Pp 5 / PN500) TaxID=670386 RepID=D3BB39_HETP5|nr:MCM family protein [Heterostelium album PN500]EFA81776.1 MCM family protein [Heterostelium album PN500]|eukprot:XP_020433893.1 MCM family protein [Heterostelium album PN500]
MDSIKNQKSKQFNKMSGWDQGNVYVSGGGGISGSRALNDQSTNSSVDIQTKFLQFIREWKNQDNSFIYRDQLSQRYNLEQYYLEVNLDHLDQFDSNLSYQVLNKPNEVIPLFENAAKLAVKQMKFKIELKDINDIQVVFVNSQDSTSIRSLKSNHIAKLIKISGIVVSASRTQPRPVLLVAKCRVCGHQLNINVSPGITLNPLPAICDEGQNKGLQCGNSPYHILSDRSKFVNQQLLKLQESPDTIPTGEMPRHIQLSLDRYLVEKVTPGTRISVLGVFGIYTGANVGKKREVAGSATIRTAYIRALGITSDTDKGGRYTVFFTPKEEDQFRKFSKRPDLYQIMADSIAPSIYGHKDIKKAITCQLFGGSSKKLPDRMKLRGDINLLLLGDPGTAKSQLLKFVEKVAPISVYTSGKGSSAAGLTASVIREPSTGEFYLEGGAMVVADGGVVCIDEFDKMDVNDRVAIHEAMEQQTISIAKAGITTILNSRTSVLAAANPVYGRYDDMKSAGDNIDFQATILSRFDLIFVVRDPRIKERDQSIANHVIGIHMSGTSGNSSNELDINFLKKYISFCRSRCSPRLSDDAIEALKNHYVSIRATVRQKQDEDGQVSAIPITIRQLEAIVRISESLAKMSLSTTATNQHVMEAIRLFTISTYDAITTNNAVGEQITPQLLQEVVNAENILKKRIPIGSKVGIRNLTSQLNGQLSPFAIRKALDILVKREEFDYVLQGKAVIRKN